MIREADISTIIHALVSWMIMFGYTSIVGWFYIEEPTLLKYLVTLIVGNIIGTTVNAMQECYMLIKKGHKFNIYDILAGWMFLSVAQQVLKIKSN